VLFMLSFLAEMGTTVALQCTRRSTVDTKSSKQLLEAKLQQINNLSGRFPEYRSNAAGQAAPPCRPLLL
jgi:hypothetical protein